MSDNLGSHLYLLTPEEQDEICLNLRSVFPQYQAIHRGMLPFVKLDNFFEVGLCGKYEQKMCPYCRIKWKVRDAM